MNNTFEDIEKLFKISIDSTIEFKEVCGFTFVFEKRIITFRGKISSAEIWPLGIIYDENKKHYFAPLDEHVDVDRVVEAYMAD